MKAASLLLASLLAALPVAAAAQDSGASMDGPSPGAPPPSEPGTVAVVADAGPKPPKSGPYVGFSFGTGKGTLYGNGSSMDIDEALGATGESPTTLNMQVRFGWGTGDFLFGTQMNLTRSWVDVNGTSVGLQFFAFDLVATWWSQEMGLYSRVGIGPSQFTAYAGDSTSDAVSGVELMFGVGATMGGLGVGIDFFRQTYDIKEAGFDSVSYVLATLSLDMY